MTPHDVRPYDVLIIAFVTAGHVEECANMLWWLRQSEPHVAVRLFALDSEAKDAFIPSPILDVKYLAPLPTSSIPCAAAIRYCARVNVTRDLSALLTARVQAIASEVATAFGGSFLQRPPGASKLAPRPVLLMDTDIIVLKPFLREMLSDYPASRVDFVTQRGMSHNGPHNGGFILFHPTRRSVAFTAEFARSRKIRTPANDQGVFNSLIKETYAGVRVDLLPSPTFPVGGVYFGNQKSCPPRGDVPPRKRDVPPRRREELPPAARLVHNNCIIGLQSKIERLKHYGLWNLSQARASIIRPGFTQKLDTRSGNPPGVDAAVAFVWGNFFWVLAYALVVAVCGRVVCGVTIERAKE